MSSVGKRALLAEWVRRGGAIMFAVAMATLTAVGLVSRQGMRFAVAFSFALYGVLHAPRVSQSGEGASTISLR